MPNRPRLAEQCLKTVTQLIASKPCDQYLAHLILRALDPLHQALQVGGHGPNSAALRMNAKERALIELINDIRGFENLSIAFEAYRPHFERTLTLIQKLIVTDGDNLSSLEGYEEHLDELKKFYLSLPDDSRLQTGLEGRKQK